MEREILTADQVADYLMSGLHPTRRIFSFLMALEFTPVWTPPDKAHL